MANAPLYMPVHYTNVSYVYTIINSGDQHTKNYGDGLTVASYGPTDGSGNLTDGPTGPKPSDIYKLAEAFESDVRGEFYITAAYVIYGYDGHVYGSCSKTLTQYIQMYAYYEPGGGTYVEIVSVLPLTP
jgi:hypothetical protein